MVGHGCTITLLPMTNSNNNNTPTLDTHPETRHADSKSLFLPFVDFSHLIVLGTLSRMCTLFNRPALVLTFHSSFPFTFLVASIPVEHIPDPPNSKDSILQLPQDATWLHG